MSIYRTGNSPFWHVRIYDNLRKRYIVRSSKEKARLTAKEVAEELFDEHRSKKNQAVAVSRDTSFRHYAEKLQAHEKAMAARMRGKRFFTDTRAILAPTVRKGSKEKRIGMLEYFGDYDVSKITAGMVREYFQKVDEKRDTPLAASTKAKHGMVMRKVLTLAYEDGLIDTLPPMPKNRVKDNPRTSFSEAEYKHLLTVTRECIERGDMVRNTPVPWDMYYLIVMLVHTFMRPTESEIFAIRHCDVTVKDNPKCLHIMANGKTGNPDVPNENRVAYLYKDLPETKAAFSREVLLDLIHQHAGRIKYAMIDDDLVFKKRNAKYWTGVADMHKSKREATPAEILRLFETASAWLDEDGIGIVGVSDDGVPPAKTEYSDTKGVFGCIFLDGNMIAEVIDDADTSIRVAEDVLFLFECLSKGINTRMANEFLATNKSLGKELKGRRPVWEGMFDQMPKDHFQTSEHYDALRHIADRFPEGMEIFEKGGRMKNKKSWKKVYRCRLAG